MRIGIFVFDGVEELDFVGPYEVLSWWAQHGSVDVEVVTFARDEGPITGAKGLQVVPHATRDRVGPLDVLIYPGGQGVRPQVGDHDLQAWLRRLHADGTLLVSVCTGAWILADAGLLDGRPATTHWAGLDRLAELGTDITLRPQDRFVDDGDVVTAAGVSAGIDVALHLVARLASEEEARQVRRGIQYDPAPPV